MFEYNAFSSMALLSALGLFFSWFLSIVLDEYERQRARPLKQIFWRTLVRFSWLMIIVFGVSVFLWLSVAACAYLKEAFHGWAD